MHDCFLKEDMQVTDKYIKKKIQRDNQKTYIMKKQ